MNRISRIVSAAAIALVCLALGTAGAHGHWHGGPRFGFDFVIGPWWWDAPGCYYPPPVVVAPSPLYVQPSTAQMPAPAYYWYFCRESNAYYPYVGQCPGGWQQVNPHPPAPGAPPNAPR